MADLVEGQAPASPFALAFYDGPCDGFLFLLQADGWNMYTQWGELDPSEAGNPGIPTVLGWVDDGSVIVQFPDGTHQHYATRPGDPGRWLWSRFCRT